VRASDLMTTELVTIRTTQSIKEAADLMLHHRIGALPVLDSQDRLAGIISQSDLIRRCELGTERKRHGLARFFTDTVTLAEEYVRSHAMTAGDVMTMALVTARPDASLADIADLMEKHGINRIPILENERLVGIVARHDLVRALAGHAPALLAGGFADRMIHDAIRSEIDRQPWANANDFDITVVDGNVTLAGVLPSQAERNAALVLTRNIPGVKSVEDCITIVPVIYPPI
jgi:CBS domain-containing protein